MPRRGASRVSTEREAVVDDSVRTLVIDARGLVREAVSLLLAPTRFNVVRSAAALTLSAAEQFETTEARLLVIGVSNHDLDAAAEQIRLFKAANAAGAAAVLVGDDDLDERGAALLFASGASALLSQSTTPEVLVKCLDMILLGEAVVSQQFMPLMLGADKPDGPLTESEESTTPFIILPSRRSG
jgi:DNA-binding NarL/FixJ family response regulator